MRKSIIAGAAITASLALAGTAQADTVQTFNGDDWATTALRFSRRLEGVHFGTYANGGAAGGSLQLSRCQRHGDQGRKRLFVHVQLPEQAGEPGGCGSLHAGLPPTPWRWASTRMALTTASSSMLPQCGATPGVPVTQGVNLTLGTANAQVSAMPPLSVPAAMLFQRHGNEIVS